MKRFRSIRPIAGGIIILWVISHIRHNTRVSISYYLLFIMVTQYWHANRVRGRSHARIVRVCSSRVIVSFVHFYFFVVFVYPPRHRGSFRIHNINYAQVHIIMVYYYCNTSTHCMEME